MAKTKTAVSVDELVKSALLKAAEVGEAKLTGKDGLFSSAKGANADAIAECQNAEKPLLAVVRKEGKSEFVGLTPAGFERIANELAEERVGAVAKSVAQRVPLASRANFIQETIGRTPPAATELLPLLEEAIAAEKAEQEARIAAATKRKAAEETSRKALERAIQLLDTRRQARVEALRRELEAEGESTEEVVLPLRIEPTLHKTPVAPTTTEENDFRRDVAKQLAASWRATWEMNKPEVREFLESAMWNINGLKLIGEVGERIAFSGKLHESIPGVFNNDTVRIVRPGWVLDEDAGEFVVLKAVIEK